MLCLPPHPRALALLSLPLPCVFLCVLYVCSLVCLCSFATLSLGAESTRETNVWSRLLFGWHPHTPLSPFPRLPWPVLVSSHTTARVEYEEEGRPRLLRPLGAGASSS